MKKILEKYLFFLTAAAALTVIFIFDNPLGAKAVSVTFYSLQEMLLAIPPIFILLGLLDVWVPREALTKHMGSGSGIKGILLAIFTGSAAVGPLYGAFPVAAVLLKKAPLSLTFSFFWAPGQRRKYRRFSSSLQPWGSFRPDAARREDTGNHHHRVFVERARE